jgi:arylsulfatase
MRCGNAIAMFLTVFVCLLMRQDAPGAPAGKLRVKAMTFNIRYDNPGDGPNRWSQRREIVADVIRRYEGDFVGLQEALPHQVAYLRETLPEYGFLSRSRQVDPQEGEAVPVLYRRERWQPDPKQQGTFWLSETPEVPASTTWGNSIPRIATWARMIEKETGRGVYVYNVHFDHQSENSRRKSAVLLARRIVDRKHPDPVVVTGDFNAAEASVAIRYLKGDEDESPLKLIDTFRAKHPGEELVGTFGGFAGRKEGAKIDYVFALPGTEVHDAEIDRYHLEGRYPSDHYPVTAEVTLDAPQEPITTAEGDSRPNILLIMCDDMGYSDVGCYGGEIQTPHIDRLAKEGMRFTQFYNCAKCTTTRASVVTGLHPRRDRGGLLRQNMVTIGEVLGAAGYRTALSGKWHLGHSPTTHPFHRGFQEYYGLLDGCCNFFNPVQPDPPYKGGRVRTFGHNDRRITEFPDDYYTTDAFSDHAAEQIRRFAQTGKPFFLHVCYTAPHYPLHAKPHDIAKYQGKYRIGWDELRRRRHRRQIEMGLIDPGWQLPGRDEGTPPWEEEENKEYEDLRMAVYAAMIDAMDQGIGRILAALKETGVEDNTLVMFLSDNGGCAENPGGTNAGRIPGPKEYYVACGRPWAYAQNTPFRRYKAWVHEGGIATPLVVRWPAVIRPGAITRQVGHIIDFMPTCVELAQTEYPAEFNGRQIVPVEGKSLVPIFQGKDRAPHETLCWEWAGNRAVRQGDWKLVWDKAFRRWELYDLKADRTETNDLAGRQPDRAEQMSQAWFQWAERTGLKVARN